MGLVQRWLRPDPPANVLVEHLHPDVAAFLASWNAPALTLALSEQPRPRLQQQDCLVLDLDALGPEWPDELSYLRASLPGWHIDVAGETSVRLTPPAFGGGR